MPLPALGQARDLTDRLANQAQKETERLTVGGLLEAAIGFEPMHGGFAGHLRGLRCWSLVVIVGPYPRLFRISHTD